VQLEPVFLALTFEPRKLPKKSHCVTALDSSLLHTFAASQHHCVWIFKHRHHQSKCLTFEPKREYRTFTASHLFTAVNTIIRCYSPPLTYSLHHHPTRQEDLSLAARFRHHFSDATSTSNPQVHQRRSDRLSVCRWA
jgi:hypothetical protein